MTQAIGQYVGIDVGDRTCEVCVLEGGDASVLRRFRFDTAQYDLRRAFKGMERSCVVLETGTHSLWIARTLRAMGHEVFVVDARRVRAVTHDARKCDRRDAEVLARLARADMTLLRPVHVRSVDTQLHRGAMRARNCLVEARSKIVGSVRGICKALGLRLPKCSTEVFARRVREDALAPEVTEAVGGQIEAVKCLSEQIALYDEYLERVAAELYPVTEHLREVVGVGPLTSLAFVLAVEDPTRFTSSRDVGAYVGLVPRLDQSGAHDPRLPITKQGDPYLRRLLVGAATYIVNRGPDCTLKRFGLRLREQGGRSPGKRAATAVARKLAVLLHRLWLTGEVYEPMRGIQDAPAAAGGEATA